jgi:hypothetical protein
MPLQLPKTLSHTSPVVNFTVAYGDIEGDAKLIGKMKGLDERLGATYPGVPHAYVFQGDATDKLPDPAESLAFGSNMAHIAGNRDDNIAAFLLKLNKEYANFMYEASLEIKTQGNKGDYAAFYKQGATLNTGDAWFKAVEETNIATLKYKIPNTNNEELALNWIDPNQPDFHTFAEAECKRYGKGWATLSNDDKVIMLLTYLHACTRGAPDAFMYWAIDNAQDAAIKYGNQFNKKLALEQYNAFKKLKGDNSAKPEDVVNAYLLLRSTLNAAYGLQGNADKNPLICKNSFEMAALEFFKNPINLINYICTADVVHIVGDKSSKNRMAIMHGGATRVNDLSVPDGKPPAITLDEYQARSRVVRKRFRDLYYKAQTSGLKITENTEYVRLIKGFGYMSLPFTAIADTTIPGFDNLKGTTTSVMPEQIEKVALDTVYKPSGIVAVLRGHQPSPGVSIALQKEDPNMVVLTGDTTNYNDGQAATITFVADHKDGARTLGAVIQDKAGYVYVLEVMTIAQNGLRIWPEDPQQRAIQRVCGQKLVFGQDQIDAFIKENETDPRIVRVKKANKLEEFKEHLAKQNFVVQYVATEKLAADNTTMEPVFSILCTGDFFPSAELNDNNKMNVFMGFRTNMTYAQVVAALPAQNSNKLHEDFFTKAFTAFTEIDLTAYSTNEEFVSQKLVLINAFNECVKHATNGEQLKQLSGHLASQPKALQILNAQPIISWGLVGISQTTEWQNALALAQKNLAILLEHELQDMSLKIEAGLIAQDKQLSANNTGSVSSNNNNNSNSNNSSSAASGSDVFGSDRYDTFILKLGELRAAELFSEHRNNLHFPGRTKAMIAIDNLIDRSAVAPFKHQLWQIERQVAANELLGVNKDMGLEERLYRGFKTKLDAFKQSPIANEHRDGSSRYVNTNIQVAVNELLDTVEARIKALGKSTNVYTAV